MDKKNIYLDYEMRFQEIRELNPSFDAAKIAVAYHGLNRNQSSISKEVFNNAASSLFNIPVVGRYIPEEDDFGGHDVIVTESNGSQSIEVATVPFGVVPESANVSWETITEEDGTEREYLTVDCVIWKRSYGYKKLVSQEKWSQSMEITVNDYELDENNIMTIKDFTFCALCILGNNVEPCFESANIQFSATPDNEDFKQNFSAMLSELKELTAQDLKEVFEKETEEGGEEELDKENIVFDDEVTEETGGENTGDTTGEENTSTETPGSDDSGSSSGSDSSGGSSDSGSSSGEESSDTSSILPVGADDQPKSRKKRPDFEQEYSRTYNELYEALTMAVDSKDETEVINGEIVSETIYWLCDFDDEYVYCRFDKYSAEGITSGNVRARYSKSDDGIELSSFEEMFVKWLTASEVEELENNRKELNALRDFKADRLEEIHREEVDTYINDNFSDTMDTEEFKALGDEIYSLETEQLTEKLYAIRGKHAVFSVVSDEAKNKNNESTKIPVESKKSKIVEGRYGNLFATYAKNN